jgi:23S rRNA (uracil1939-C5)-methyltransferase
MADIVQACVLGRARSYQPQSVVDAYAGAGDSAVALSGEGVTVTAIELDPDATEWSASRLQAPSRAVQARVEDALPATLPADVVILNPPRAGVDARVAAILEEHARGIRGVIYVSCNPATLARDLSRLPSYTIESVHGFDMFPQTAHVETVCELRPIVPVPAA